MRGACTSTSIIYHLSSHKSKPSMMLGFVDFPALTFLAKVIMQRVHKVVLFSRIENLSIPWVKIDILTEWFNGSNLRIVIMQQVRKIVIFS